MADRSRHFQSSTAEIVIDDYTRVRQILEVEAEAVSRAAANLDALQVETAVGLIYGCSGKVIVTGVGKSGVIAQKIAQTLASTGTVALFLHPSDALHGGLGLITAGDVLIAISNSGETDELLAMLPAIGQRHVRVISISGNKDSTLSRSADAVLDSSVDREACPLNLAPTCSTTVALAIGDAVAMAVMSKRGLSTADFAVNHPSGRLGKRLTIRVADLMHPPPAVRPESSWLDVVHSLSRFALGAVTVAGSDGSLIGVITEGDLRRAIERTPVDRYDSLTAEAIMTTGPVTTTSEMLAVDALKLMEERPSQIAVLPVVDGDGRCTGLIRLHDIVRAGL